MGVVGWLTESTTNRETTGGTAGEPDDPIRVAESRKIVTGMTPVLIKAEQLTLARQARFQPTAHKQCSTQYAFEFGTASQNALQVLDLQSHTPR